MELKIIEMFNLFFHVLTHVLIVSSILAIIYLVAHMIFSPKDGIENTVRSSVFATGFLI